jgi:CheY-like chemotaxis protein
MRKKLLLADDSITIQKVVELTFPSDEFEVVTAGNGRLAVDKALAFLPDIVLCDVIMPQLDGYQVCEALRASAQLSKVPILLLNGAFEPYDAERAKSVGALGNVSKPFDPPALVARVKEILNERSTAAYERPSLAALDAVGNAIDEGKTADASIPATTVPHEYTYDESETHPVSTVEVPLDVRELAARSLSLDAPVFAPAEPDVLSSEEPADFAETLHGPLDAEAPAAEAESALEMTPEEEAPPVEEIEAIEEIEPVAATGEIEAPAIPMAPPAAETPAPAAEEPMEFDAEPEAAQVAPTLPPTLPPLPPPPPAPTVAATPVVHEFSGVHEFDPGELDTPVAQTAETAPIQESEAMTLPAELSAPEVMPPFEPQAAIGLPSPAPTPVVAPPPVPVPPPAPVAAPAPPVPAPVVHAAPAAAPVPMPAPAPAPVEAGAFDSIGEPSPTPAAPKVAAPAAGTLPSAEVAVPVDMVQQIAQRVISQVSERVIREIAWDVIPGLAEKLIRAEIEKIKARAESERD